MYIYGKSMMIRGYSILLYFIALKTPCFQIKDIEHEGWLTKQGMLYVQNSSCYFQHYNLLKHV